MDLRKRNWAENPGFDAVVGNPPYDVLAEKERKEDLSQFMAYVNSDEKLHPAMGRKIDLFRLFVAKAMSLVRPEATAGLIVPMSLLAGPQTMRLRKHLLKQHAFLRVDAFPQKDDPSRRVFPEAKLPTCVVIMQSAPKSCQTFVVTTHPGRSLDEISGRYRCEDADLWEFDREGLAVPLLPSDTAWSLGKKLSSKSEWLCSIGDLVQTYQGEINETTMVRFLSTDPSVGPKVLRGGNVQRYEFQPKAKQGVDKFIDVQAYERKIGGEKVAHTRLPRFGYQRNAALDNWRRLIFAPLPTPSYCFDSISYFSMEDKAKACALLALLNSQLLEWRFRLTSTSNHVNVHEIADLPAIRFSFSTPADARQRYAEKGRRLYDQFCTKSNVAGARRFVAHHLDGGRSDVVHDLLAYLAEQMIEMHKEKQGHQRAFRLDLAGYLDEKRLAKLNRLYTPKKPPKEGIKNYDRKLTAYEQAVQLAQAQLGPLAGETLNLDDFWRLNQAQWMWLLSQRLGKAANMSALVSVYEQYRAQLAPLMRRIQRTDWLIDLVVYQLYGLTEEEIAIVEGR